MRKEYIEDLENEIWIHNKGRIIGKKGRLLKCTPNKDGYLQCSITFEDGFHAGSVHRAVAYAFLGNPNNLPEVNHIDGVKHHNYIENLEWVTKKENQQHEVMVLKQRSGENNYMSKMTDDMVIEIYNLCKEGVMKYKDIAKMYNILPGTVSQITTGQKWRYLKLEPFILKQGSRGKGRKSPRKNK